MTEHERAQKIDVAQKNINALNYTLTYCHFLGVEKLVKRIMDNPDYEKAIHKFSGKHKFYYDYRYYPFYRMPFERKLKVIVTLLEAVKETLRTLEKIKPEDLTE